MVLSLSLKGEAVQEERLLDPEVEGICPLQCQELLTQ
jgi:hypothetical protein